MMKMNENGNYNLSNSNSECTENEIETNSSIHGSTSDDSGDTKKSLINLRNAENLNSNENRINKSNYYRKCLYSFFDLFSDRTFIHSKYEIL